MMFRISQIIALPYSLSDCVFFLAVCNGSVHWKCIAPVFIGAYVGVCIMCMVCVYVLLMW